MNHLIHQIHPESAGLFADQLPRVAPIDYSHSRVAPKDLQVLPVGSRIIRLPRGITNCRRSYERCFTLRVRVPPWSRRRTAERARPLSVVGSPSSDWSTRIE